MAQWDATSPNFAKLDAQTIEDLRDENGMLTFRMLWSEPGDKKAIMNAWRQRSDPLMPCKRVDGFVPLLIDKGADDFGGLRGSKSKVLG